MHADRANGLPGSASPHSESLAWTLIYGNNHDMIDLFQKGTYL